MLIKALLLVLLAITGANATCICYTANNSMVTGNKIILSNAYSDADFSSCYSAPCGFLAYSGDPTKGWSLVNVKFGSKVDSTGVFKIYDGNTTDTNRLMNQYTTSNDQQNMTLTSSTPFIFVVYSQVDTNNANSYYGSITAGGPLAAPTTTAAPTVAPTPRPYSNPLYPKDPWLITHDILVMVNQKTDQGTIGLTNITNLVTDFVGLLSVNNGTDSINSVSQSRLGLATVTPYAPYYSAQGEIWRMSINDTIGALPKSGVSINVDVVSSLKNVVPTFFKVSDPIAPTRRNVQRSVILFTAWWDNTQALDDNVQKVFDDYGVNLAIIGYNTDSAQLVNNKWYNYVSLTSTTPDDVAKFVNGFYFNSNFGNSLINNWCQKGADPVFNAAGSTFMEPSNYGGPPANGEHWNPTFDGQKGRYCNFQDSTYTYKKQNPAAIVGVTVYYELEVERDYLKFYADGVEIESFTGMDVNNAYFEVNATVITARFTTNNLGIQRGFSVTIKESS